MFSYILDSPDSRKSTGPEQITKFSHNNKNQEQKGSRTFFFHVPPWTLVVAKKGWKGAMWKGWDVQTHGWPAHKVQRVEKEQKGVDSLKEPSVRKTHPEKGVERVYVWLWTCTRVGKVYRGTCGRRIACRVSGGGMTRSLFFLSLYPHYRRCFEKRRYRFVWTGHKDTAKRKKKLVFLTRASLYKRTHVYRYM